MDLRNRLLLFLLFFTFARSAAWEQTCVADVRQEGMVHSNNGMRIYRVEVTRVAPLQGKDTIYVSAVNPGKTRRGKQRLFDEKLEFTSQGQKKTVEISSPQTFTQPHLDLLEWTNFQVSRNRERRLSTLEDWFLDRDLFSEEIIDAWRIGRPVEMDGAPIPARELQMSLYYAHLNDDPSRLRYKRHYARFVANRAQGRISPDPLVLRRGDYEYSLHIAPTHAGVHGWNLYLTTPKPLRVDLGQGEAYYVVRDQINPLRWYYYPQSPTLEHRVVGQRSWPQISLSHAQTTDPKNPNQLKPTYTLSFSLRINDDPVLADQIRDEVVRASRSVFNLQTGAQAAKGNADDPVQDEFASSYGQTQPGRNVGKAAIANSLQRYWRAGVLPELSFEPLPADRVQVSIFIGNDEVRSELDSKGGATGRFVARLTAEQATIVRTLLLNQTGLKCKLRYVFQGTQETALRRTAAGMLWSSTSMPKNMNDRSYGNTSVELGVWLDPVRITHNWLDRIPHQRAIYQREAVLIDALLEEWDWAREIGYEPSREEARKWNRLRSLRGRMQIRRTSPTQSEQKRIELVDLAVNYLLWSHDRKRTWLKSASGPTWRYGKGKYPGPAGESVYQEYLTKLIESQFAIRESLSRDSELRDGHLDFLSVHVSPLADRLYRQEQVGERRYYVRTAAKDIQRAFTWSTLQLYSTALVESLCRSSGKPFNEAILEEWKRRSTLPESQEYANTPYDWMFDLLPKVGVLNGERFRNEQQKQLAFQLFEGWREPFDSADRCVVEQMGNFTLAGARYDDLIRTSVMPSSKVKYRPTALQLPSQEDEIRSRIRVQELDIIPAVEFSRADGVQQLFAADFLAKLRRQKDPNSLAVTPVEVLETTNANNDPIVRIVYPTIRRIVGGPHGEGLWQQKADGQWKDMELPQLTLSMAGMEREQGELVRQAYLKAQLVLDYRVKHPLDSSTITSTGDEVLRGVPLTYQRRMPLFRDMVSAPTLTSALAPITFDTTWLDWKSNGKTLDRIDLRLRQGGRLLALPIKSGGRLASGEFSWLAMRDIDRYESVAPGIRFEVAGERLLRHWSGNSQVDAFNQDYVERGQTVELDLDAWVEAAANRDLDQFGDVTKPLPPNIEGYVDDLDSSDTKSVPIALVGRTPDEYVMEIDSPNSHYNLNVLPLMGFQPSVVLRDAVAKKFEITAIELRPNTFGGIQGNLSIHEWGGDTKAGKLLHRQPYKLEYQPGAPWQTFELTKPLEIKPHGYYQLELTGSKGLKYFRSKPGGPAVGTSAMLYLGAFCARFHIRAIGYESVSSESLPNVIVWQDDPGTKRIDLDFHWQSFVAPDDARMSGLSFRSDGSPLQGVLEVFEGHGTLGKKIHEQQFSLSAPERQVGVHTQWRTIELAEPLLLAKDWAYTWKLSGVGTLSTAPNLYPYGSCIYPGRDYAFRIHSDTIGERYRPPLRSIAAQGRGTFTFDPGKEEVWQSFTSRGDYPLTAISFFPYTRAGAGEIRVFEGVGNGGKQLGKATFDLTVGESRWETVRFSAPIPLKTNGEYTFQISGDVKVFAISDYYRGGRAHQVGTDLAFRAYTTGQEPTGIHSLPKLDESNLLVSQDKADDSVLGSRSSWQSFKAPKNAVIRGLSLICNEKVGTRLRVVLYDGVGVAGSIVAAQDVETPPPVTGRDWRERWYTFRLHEPFLIRQGGEYTWELQGAEGLTYARGDVYPEGRADRDGMDYCFRIYADAADPKIMPKPAQIVFRYESQIHSHQGTEMWQSFEAPETGLITAIEWATFFMPSGELVFYEGVGRDGDVIHRQAIASRPRYDRDSRWEGIGLTKPVQLVAGKSYTWAVLGSESNRLYAGLKRSTNAYLGGQSSHTDWDFAFRLYSREMTPTDDLYCERLNQKHLIGSQTPSSPAVIDQSQFDQLVYAKSLDGWQSFTAPGSGTISALAVHHRARSEFLGRLAIFEGVGADGRKLHEQSYARRIARDAQPESGEWTGEWLVFPFPKPIQVTKGRTYTWSFVNAGRPLGGFDYTGQDVYTEGTSSLPSGDFAFKLFSADIEERSKVFAPLNERFNYWSMLGHQAASQVTVPNEVWQSFNAYYEGPLDGLGFTINAAEAGKGELTVYEGVGVDGPVVTRQPYRFGAGQSTLLIRLTKPLEMGQGKTYTWQLTGVKEFLAMNANPSLGPSSVEGKNFLFARNSQAIYEKFVAPSMKPQKPEMKKPEKTMSGISLAEVDADNFRAVIKQESASDYALMPPWQSFTAPADDTLEILQLRVNAYGGIAGKLSIYEGQGVKGRVLHSQPYVCPSVGGAPWKALKLTKPLTLSKGKVYTWELTGGNGIYFSGKDEYPGGRSADPNRDLAFRLYIGAKKDSR